MGAKNLGQLGVLTLTLKGTDGVQTYELQSGESILGRSKDADIQVHHEEVSRKHLKIKNRGGEIVLVDLGSENGTFVNGKALLANEDYSYIPGNPVTLGKSKDIIYLAYEDDSDKTDVSWNVSKVDHEQTSVSSKSIRTGGRSYNSSKSDMPDGRSYHSSKSLNSVPSGSVYLGEKSNSAKSEFSFFNVDDSQLGDDLIDETEGPNNREEVSKIEDELRALDVDLDVENSIIAKINQEEPPALPKKEVSAVSKKPNFENSFRKAMDHQGSSPRALPPKLSQKKEPAQSNLGSELSGIGIKSNKTSEFKRNIKFNKTQTPSTLIGQLGRDVVKFIDQSYFNVPPDKLAKKKGEKILEEVFKLAQELELKAHKKAESIVQKAKRKARSLKEEGEGELERILSEGRQKVLKMEERRMTEVEKKGLEIEEDAKYKAEAMETRAEDILKGAKSKAEHIVSEAANEAGEIISRAKAQTEEEAQEVRQRNEELIQEAKDEKFEAEEETKRARKNKENILLELEKFKQEVEELKGERSQLDGQIRKAEADYQYQSEKLKHEQDRIQDLIERLQEENKIEIGRLESIKAELEEEKNHIESAHKKFEAQMGLKKRNLEKEYQAREADAESELKKFEAGIRLKKTSLEKDFKAYSKGYDEQKKKIKNDVLEYEKEISRRKENLESEQLAFEKHHKEKCKQADQEFKSVQNEHKKYLKELTLEIDDLEKQKVKAEQMIQDLRHQNQSIFDKLEHSESELKRNHDENKRVMEEMAAGRDELSRLRSDRLKVEHDIENLKSIHEKELDSFSDLKKQTMEKLKEDKEASQKKIAQMDLAAQSKYKKLIAEAEERVANMTQNAQSQFESTVARAEKQAEVILEGAEETKDQLVAEGEAQKSQAEKYSRELTAQVNSWKVEQELDFDKQKSEKLRALNLELADVRIKREEELRCDIAAMKEDFVRYKESQAENLALALDRRMASRIKPHLKSASQFDDMSMDVQKIVMALLVPEREMADEDIKKVLGIQAKTMASSKGFWIKSMAVAMGIFLIVLGPGVWENFKSQTKELASKDDSSAATNYLKKVEERRKNKPKFAPEMTDDYLSSYTDRVLYMKSYVDNELEKEYRQKWILELNKFFVDKLGVGDEVIVTFIAKESGLIRDLSNVRAEINPQFVEDSENKMKFLEKKFLDEVKRSLKSKRKFAKFLKYKEEFYKKHHQ